MESFEEGDDEDDEEKGKGGQDSAGVQPLSPSDHNRVTAEMDQMTLLGELVIVPPGIPWVLWLVYSKKSIDPSMNFGSRCAFTIKNGGALRGHLNLSCRSYPFPTSIKIFAPVMVLPE
jgi:hypothetical protein